LAQYDINLREYWRILKKRKLVVILITIILSIFSVSYAILRAPTPVYRTTCSIEFEKENTVEGLFATTVSFFESDDIATQISIIRGYPVFRRVSEKMGLVRPGAATEEEPLGAQVVAVIEGLQSKVEVEREKFTNILHITVTDTNPAFAQKLANTVALTYQEFHAEQQTKRIKEALKYIDSQLQDVREKLRTSEEEFNRFTQTHELISIDFQSEGLLERSQEIQSDIRRLDEDRVEFEGLLERLKGYLKDPFSAEHDFYSTKASMQYQNANEALVALILKRDTLLKDFTPRHPDVKAISNQIIENARKMAFLLQNQLKGLEKRRGDLRAELNDVDHKTKVLMDQKLEFDRLKRKVDLYNEMTVLLERKNQEALIRRAEKPEEVNIVKPALLPSAPINPPNTAATGMMGIIIGLVIGMVIAFVAETFDTSLGAIEDVEETLGTQVLGVVPQADAEDVRESLKERHPGEMGAHALRNAVNLISHFSPKSMMAESFRALRTNIHFKDPERKVKAIAVTSSSPEEGKTLVAANLAIAMAQGGMKTLLIGSDLRKPVMNRVFGVDKTPGLTDILLGNYPWRDVIKTVTDMIMGKISLDEIMMTPGLDNLHMITSGTIPPNPAELIESQRLVEFIEEAKQEYDIVIFDSSPILSTADSAILAGRVDGVLLVYRVGAVSRGLLKRSATQLEQVKCHLMGVILNGMRPDVSPDFQDYKYYTYYYSYGEEGKQKKGGDKRRGFPFVGKKEDRYEATQEIWLSKLEDEASERPEKKRHSGRWVLMVIGVACLAGGLLWQNNVIHPFRQSDSEEGGKKDGIKVPIQRAPQNPSTVKGSQGTAVKALVGEKAVSDVVTIMPEALDSAPKDAVPEGKPGFDAVASVGEPSGQIPTQSAVKGAGKSGAREPKRIPEKAPSQAEAESPALEYEAALQPTNTVSPEPSSVTDELEAPVPPEMWKTSPKSPYSLRLGAFRTLERAKKAVAEYKQNGLSPYWTKVDLGEAGVWFRVYLGHFEDLEEARRFREEYRLKGSLVKETRYSTLVGVYEDQYALDRQILSLQRLDYAPYAIRGQGGKYRLLVGAFITEEGAEDQRRDLEAKGIQSVVVTR